MKPPARVAPAPWRGRESEGSGILRLQKTTVCMHADKLETRGSQEDPLAAMAATGLLAYGIFAEQRRDRQTGA